MIGKFNLGGKHGTTGMHLEIAGVDSASKCESFGGLAADITPWPRYSSFNLFGFSMEDELVLAMKRMSLKRGWRQGTEVMKLKITILACIPTANAKLLAT